MPGSLPTSRRPAVAAVLAAIAGWLVVVTPAAPAQAAACTSSDAVTVVVDPHQLGGAVQAVCDPAGDGKSGDRLFTDNGFTLDYVTRQPGFVCRVDGAPASEACVTTPPADAYWALFWSDGSGGWTYASQGVGSVSVPAGGFIAFSWQGSAGRTPPRVSPVSATPSPSPTPHPTHSGSPSSHPGSSPPAGTTAPSASTPASAPASSATTTPRHPRRHHTPTADPAQPSTSAPATADQTATEPAAAAPDEGSRLPLGVVLGVLAAVGAGAAFAFARRSRGTHRP